MRPEEELSPVLQELVRCNYDPEFDDANATEEDKAIMDLIPFRTFAWNERRGDLWPMVEHSALDDKPVAVWIDYVTAKFFSCQRDVVAEMSVEYPRYFPEGIPLQMKMHVATIIKAQEIKLPLNIKEDICDEFCGFIGRHPCYVLDAGWYQLWWDGELHRGETEDGKLRINSGTYQISELRWLRDHSPAINAYSIDEYLGSFEPSIFEVQLR